MSLQSAWTSPPAPACYAHTGWDTFPATLTLNVILNTTWIFQSLSVTRKLVIFKVTVGRLIKYLVGDLKTLILDRYIFVVIFLSLYPGSNIRRLSVLRLKFWLKSWLNWLLIDIFDPNSWNLKQSSGQNWLNHVQI